MRHPTLARAFSIPRTGVLASRHAGFIALAVLSLGLAACGGGSSSNTEDPSTEETEAVNRAPRQKPTITWPDPASITWGTALSTAQLNASANVPGKFVYTPAAGTRLEVGVRTLSVTFTPQDRIRYSTTTTERTITVDKAEPPVRWETPSAVLQGTALTPAQITTAPYALYGIQGRADPATYTTVDGKPLGTETTSTAGTAILQATFVPTDGAHYKPFVISTTLTVKPNPTTAAIDFSDAKQTIRGFGGSAAWYYSKMSDNRLNVLFGNTLADSLGLSILRLRIAPADWNAATQTADTSQWFPELENGAAAQARGALVFASPWSPPASMKIVNTARTNALYSGRLNPAMYADYAKYLNSYVRYAASRNVNLHAVSLQNEPDWDPETYESCLWSPEEMKAWAGNHGAAAVAGTNAKLMAPESFYFSQVSTDGLLADPKAAANISIVGGHLYGGAPNYPGSAARLGKEVWMTEHYLDSVNKSANQTAWQTSLDDAIAIAKEIHDGMTLAQYNAYVHWWLVNSNDSTPTGLITSGDTPTYFGIGLKHFSYFVRPGYVRYDATALPQKGVHVSAFGTPPGAPDQKTVVVLVNENTVDVNLNASINAAGRSLTTLTPYRTTQAASFARQAPIDVSGNALSVVLPARSITTLVN
jgi:glucuronoarabinoxylan endo-1,4-beta-xylanase